MKGRVLTNEEIDEIVREPWTAHLHSYEDLARTMDVMRRSAKAWHKGYELAMASKPTEAYSGNGCPSCWMNPPDHKYEDCPEHKVEPTTLRSEPTTQSERNEPILPAGGGSSTKHTRWSDIKAKRGTSTDHVVPTETTDLNSAKQEEGR